MTHAQSIAHEHTQLRTRELNDATSLPAPDS
jgi:hypothetical protein